MNYDITSLKSKVDNLTTQFDSLTTLFDSLSTDVNNNFAQLK